MLKAAKAALGAGGGGGGAAAAAAAPAAAAPAPAAPAGGGGGAAAARELRLAAAAALFARAEHFSRAPLSGSARVKYAHVSRTFCAAADAFRVCGAWRRCAESLRAAAEAERAQLDMAACAALHADAGDVFARVDAGEAVVSLSAAAGLYASLGRVLTAANLTVAQAELEEADGARASAGKSFALAADYFTALDLVPAAAANLFRAGANLVLQLDFCAAHAAFERAARLARDDNLAKFQIPRLALGAALCLIAEWSRRRTVEVEANRRRLLASAASGASRRQQVTEAASATAAGAATAEALAAAEAYLSRAARRDAAFATSREKRFAYDALDAARAWSAADVVDHAWNYDFAAGLAPHELALVEAVFRSVEAGPPLSLVRAAREAADMNAVREEEEDVEVPVEVLEPMSKEELRKSGIMEELEAEAAADAAEEQADREAEEEIRRPGAAKARAKAAAEAARRAGRG